MSILTRRNHGKATAATRAKNKYREKTYDRMELVLPKGMKAELVELVRQGKADSNNAYVVAAVREKMEKNEMSKVALIAMLTSIREVARANGELKTVEHINKIIDEGRK